MRPVLFVTSYAPPDRIGAFTRLHERENVEFALFEGRSKHGGPTSTNRTAAPTGTSAAAVPTDRSAEPPSDHQALPFPHRYVRQHELAKLAASDAYRAVVCSTGGRIALPATWAGARRGGAALILWTSFWAHPRSAAHLLSYAALRRLYRSADAVVTYGPHVSAYVEAKGARNVHIAPQSVDNAFWSAPVADTDEEAPWPHETVTARRKFVFAGRPDREKGGGALVMAWLQSGLQAPTAALVLAGVGSSPPWVPAGGAVALAQAGVSCLAPLAQRRLRELYAAADVLVAPSIRTRTFLEPWGLVVNEAMSRGLAVIASDAVGAVAGGLVRDGHNGLVVPAGDSGALAAAMRKLADDPELCARLGAQGAQDVRAYTHDAWAEGFTRALSSLGLSANRS